MSRSSCNFLTKAIMNVTLELTLESEQLALCTYMSLNGVKSGDTD